MRLKEVYRSDGFKTLLGLPQRPFFYTLQFRNRPLFSVDIHASMGFFAVLQMVLFVLMYCEEKKLLPDISAHGGIYGDAAGEVDWFALYFERVKRYELDIENRLARRKNLVAAKLFNVQQLGLRSRYEKYLRLEEASRLFCEYYSPTAEILREVDSIAADLSISSNTLGLHYRGTDKSSEAGRVSWEAFVHAIRNTIICDPKITRILLSSDEQQFLEFVQAQNLACPVNIIPSMHLSTNGKPVHFSQLDGLQIGREALVSSLLLSRCGLLLKTASYLSAWSK